MPKINKVAIKPAAKKTSKSKLSPAERSQIAKDRWAKRRESTSVSTAAVIVEQEVLEQAKEDTPPVVPPPEQPPVLPESVTVAHVNYESGLITAPSVTIPAAPQLAPVAPKKPKRIQQPKEFSVALKAAENRLAKAVVERAEFNGKLAALNAEIPSLLGIIQALKGSGTYTPPVQNEFPGLNTSGYMAPIPGFQSVGTPVQQSIPPAFPVSRAQGGAMQFGPEVLGSLEGPDDDNEDRFLGSAVNERGWV